MKSSLCLLIEPKQFFEKLEKTVLGSNYFKESALADK